MNSSRRNFFRNSASLLALASIQRSGLSTWDFEKNEGLL